MPLTQPALHTRRSLLLTLAASTAALAAACSAAPGAPPRPADPAAPTARPAEPARTIRFMAGYKAQANLPFVGAYVAEARGYFATQNLAVEITHATGQGEHLKLLLQGSIDVSTAAADSLLSRRAEDVPITSVALFGYRGQSAYAVLASSDIRSPKDWVGKTVGFKIQPTPEYLAVLSANGVDRSRLTEVPVGFDPRLLAAGKVDVYPVFESNEPDTLERLGVPVRVFRPSDYGVPSLGLTFFVRPQSVQDDPEGLMRFVKAVMKGIEEARRDPEMATDAVMKYAPQEDRAHQLAMLKTELDMADAPIARQRGLGFSTREQWQALHDSLNAFGGLKAPLGNIETAFTNAVVERAYAPNGTLLWP